MNDKIYFALNLSGKQTKYNTNKQTYSVYVCQTSLVNFEFE
jgi:hypothetical protein